MIRFTEHYVGIDCGVSRHPSAMAVLRRVQREDGPVLEVIDLARAQAVPFTAVAREVKRTVDLLDGSVTVGLDASGPGEGLAQELRRQEVRCVAMKMGGSGHRVVKRLDRWSVPSHRLYETVYQLLVQHRLRLNPGHPLTPQLVQELDACEVTYTPSGAIKYEVQMADSHGDLLVALGIAALLHEEPYAAQVNVRSRAGRGEERERRPGAPRNRDTAREVLEQRMAEREREWQRNSDPLWAPMEFGSRRR